MSLLLAHLCLSSLVVGLLALLSKALFSRLWSRPIAGYWFALAAVALGLLGSGTQFLLQGRGLPLDLPLARAVVAVGEQLGRADIFGAVEPGSELGAASTMQELTDAELLMLATLLEDDANAELMAGGVQLDPTEELAATATPWLRWLSGAYVVGVIVALLKVLRQTLGSVRLLRAAHPARDRRILRVWRSIPDRRDDIRLRVVPGLSLPACTGLFQRTILLPPPKWLPEDENALRCILTHELVHLQRGDAWGLVLQEVFRVLFWFHPAAWWLISQLDLMRELSCDELVVQRTKLRKGYAEALLSCAAGLGGGRGDRPSAQNSVALVPLTRSETQLRRRIEMLFNSKPSRGKNSTWLTVGLAGTAASVLCLSQVALAAGFKSAPSSGDTTIDLLAIDGTASVSTANTANEDDLDTEVRKLAKLAESGQHTDAELDALVANILQLTLTEQEAEAESHAADREARAQRQLAILHDAHSAKVDAEAARAESQLQKDVPRKLREAELRAQLEALQAELAHTKDSYDSRKGRTGLLRRDAELAELSTVLERQLSEELAQLNRTLAKLPQLIEAKEWATISKLGAGAAHRANDQWREWADLGRAIGAQAGKNWREIDAKKLAKISRELQVEASGLKKDSLVLARNLAAVRDKISAFGHARVKDVQAATELKLAKEQLAELEALTDLLVHVNPAESGALLSLDVQLDESQRDAVQKALATQGLVTRLNIPQGTDLATQGGQQVLLENKAALTRLLALTDGVIGSEVVDGALAKTQKATEYIGLLRNADAFAEARDKVAAKKLTVRDAQRSKAVLNEQLSTQKARLQQLEEELAARQAEVIELRRKIEREAARGGR